MRKCIIPHPPSETPHASISEWDTLQRTSGPRGTLHTAPLPPPPLGFLGAAHAVTAVNWRLLLLLLLFGGPGVRPRHLSQGTHAQPALFMGRFRPKGHVSHTQHAPFTGCPWPIHFVRGPSSAFQWRPGHTQPAFMDHFLSCSVAIGCWYRAQTAAAVSQLWRGTSSDQLWGGGGVEHRKKGGGKGENVRGSKGVSRGQWGQCECMGNSGGKCFRGGLRRTVRGSGHGTLGSSGGWPCGQDAKWHRRKEAGPISSCR